MKNLVIALLVVLLLPSCGEEGGLRGRLVLSITDAPTDDIGIKSVIIVFLSVEVKRNGAWESLKTFDQPVGVNLLEYTAGKSIQLIDQYVDPGNISAFRFTLNIANRNESLIKIPQSNVTFASGNSTPLYLADDQQQIVIETELGISATGITDITMDFDVRKSITKNNEGDFIFEPHVRVVETQETGSIRADVTNLSGRTLAFAYARGRFSNGEFTTNFLNAVTSALVRNNEFGLGFLESGEYELHFVRISEDGECIELLGAFGPVRVDAGEEKVVQINLSELSPS